MVFSYFYPLLFLHVTRHPLQEQVVDTFVPNDFLIVGGVGSNIADATMDGSEHKSVMVCTGANACGKVRSSG